MFSNIVYVNVYMNALQRRDLADMSYGSVLVQANYYSYLISYFTNYSPISDNEVSISCSDERNL